VYEPESRASRLLKRHNIHGAVQTASFGGYLQNNAMLGIIEYHNPASGWMNQMPKETQELVGNLFGMGSADGAYNNPRHSMSRVSVLFPRI